MEKFKTLNELINRLYILLPNGIIEGDEDDPISDSKLFIRLDRGDVSIYYIKDIIHTELSEVILFGDIYIDGDKLEIDENEVQEGYQDMIQTNYSGIYPLSKTYVPKGELIH